jgi:hypothetical protein
MHQPLLLIANPRVRHGRILMSSYRMQWTS